VHAEKACTPLERGWSPLESDLAPRESAPAGGEKDMPCPERDMSDLERPCRIAKFTIAVLCSLIPGVIGRCPETKPLLCEGCCW
jgi:hypothetical protein